MKYVNLTFGILWIGLWVGLVWFDFEPDKFTIGIGFICTSVFFFDQFFEKIFKQQ